MEGMMPYTKVSHAHGRAEPELFDSDVFCYVVHKQGYRGSGIHAISTSLQSAKVMAQKIADNDYDDYHSYDVYPVPMGRITCEEQELGWLNQEPLTSAVKKSSAPSRLTLLPYSDNGGEFFVVYHSCSLGTGLQSITTDFNEAQNMAKQLVNEASFLTCDAKVYRIIGDHYPLPAADYKNDQGWMNLAPLCTIPVP
jgi:hypothetical protein